MALCAVDRSRPILIGLNRNGAVHESSHNIPNWRDDHPIHSPDDLARNRSAHTHRNGLRRLGEEPPESGRFTI